MINGVFSFSRDNLPRIKDGAYVINLDDKKSKGTRWISLFIDRNKAVYFDSFGIEYIMQDKSITYNVFRIPDDDSVMCGFYCFVFMEYMLLGKTLLDYTNLFSPNDYKKKVQDNIQVTATGLEPTTT